MMRLGLGTCSQSGSNSQPPRVAASWRALHLWIAVLLIAAGWLAALPVSAAAATTGAVLAWGWNGHGQLGNGGITDSPTPVLAALPAGTTVTAIAASYYNSLALTASGQLLAWGNNELGQLGNGTSGWEAGSTVPVPVALPASTSVTAIAAGELYNLAVTISGQVLAWGDNEFGQLGSGGTTNSPVPVPVALPPGTSVTAVAAGRGHSLALTTSGQVLAWGFNNFGQLGSGGTTNSPVPVPVALPAGTTVTAIAAGYYDSLALTASGQVLAWGWNGLGQLGNGTAYNTSPVPVPVALPADTTVTAIAAGDHHSLALTTSGQLLAWGINTYGQLGSGGPTDTIRSTPVPVALPADTTVTAIAAGNFHSLALTASGQLLAWGRNAYGQVGNGNTTDSLTPVAVALPADTTVTAIAGGGEHSLAAASTPTAATTTTVTASVNPSVANQEVTYTATVTPTTSGGTVAFTDNGAYIDGCRAVGVSSGTAACKVTYGVGQTGGHNIVATYSGEPPYLTSIAPTFTQVVTEKPCTSLANCNLSGLNLQNANLANMNFSGSDLRDVNFAGANLAGANFSRASHVNKAVFTRADLTGANFSGQNLNGADFTGANLTNANLAKANLRETNLSGANLTGADLSGAHLTNAIWSSTTCPDGTNSDTNGNTCMGHL